MPVRAKSYTTLIALMGGLVLCLVLPQWQAHNLARFGMYTVLAAAATSLDVALPGLGGAISLNYLYILIGVMLLDFPQALLASMVCTLAQCISARRKPWAWNLLFNVGNSTIATACCYALYHSARLRAQGTSTPVLLFAASLAYFLANTLSVSGIIQLTGGSSPWEVWQKRFLLSAPQYLAGAALAELIDLCVVRPGWHWALPTLPVLYLIYASYRMYLGRLAEEQKHVSQMAALHLRTIEALAVAIEAKDESIHRHLQRVQAYAIEVAKELGASPEEMQALEAAALLHDIGKLAVPEYILSKPGRLTPEEFEKIKVHPEVGAEILRRVQFPYPVVPIVEAHHEKWDGSGYPLGLEGENIPLGARILSAVDCLDALSSNREYRRALPLSEAMAYIVSQSGTSFDPRVVEVLNRRLSDLVEIAQRAVAVERKAPEQIRASRPAAPGAGFEDLQTGDAPGSETRAPNFTTAIAAARQEFQMLHEVTSELGNSLSMESTISLLGTRLRSIVPHDTIAIYVHQNGRLVPQYVHGRDARLFASRDVAMGQGLTGWVAENGKPIVNGNPSVEAACTNGNDTPIGLKSAIAVPLVGVDGVVGVLSLYHGETSAFTREHLRLLLAISSKAARTIENALKYREVQKTSVTDELTGLPNTRSLFLHLDSEVERCKRTNMPLAVLVVDLDGFKLVNDRFGHLAGNRVLKMVAQGLRSSCRGYDYVARMGGDEFVLILPGMQPSAVRRKSADLGNMVVNVGRECTGEEILTLSVGEAFFPRDGADTEDLLAEADKRMYQMKKLHHSRRILRIGTDDQAILPAKAAR